MAQLPMGAETPIEAQPSPELQSRPQYPGEAESLAVLQNNFSNVHSPALWPGPFSFMYESDFLPLPYDSAGSCDCVTQWEHEHFECKRSGQLITPASWMPGGSDYEGMTKLISAAVQNMQRIKEGPYWEPLHAAPAALNRYLYQHRIDRDQSLRLIVEGIYGHMIFQDESVAARTPNWVQSYKVYRPPQPVAPTALSLITLPPSQIDGAALDSSTDSSVDVAKKFPKKKGTMRRIGKGLKRGGTWTWGKVKAAGADFAKGWNEYPNGHGSRRPSHPAALVRSNVPVEPVEPPQTAVPAHTAEPAETAEHVEPVEPVQPAVPYRLLSLFYQHEQSD